MAENPFDNGVSEADNQALDFWSRLRNAIGGMHQAPRPDRTEPIRAEPPPAARPSESGGGNQLLASLMSAAARIASSGRGVSAQDQQAKLAEAKRQKEHSEELDLRNRNYTPLDSTNQNGQPSILRGDKTGPAGDLYDQNDIYTALDGRRWVKAPPSLTPNQENEEKGRQATEAHQRNDDLLNALKAHGQEVAPNGTIPDPALSDVERYRTDEQGKTTPTGMKGTTRPADQAPGTVTHPGGRDIYIPSDEENAAAELKQKTAQADALRHLSDFPIPGDLAEKLGLDTKGGATATFRDIATAHHELLGDKTEKAATPHITTATDDNGNITITRTDPDSGKELWTRTIKGAGAKRKDPDAPAKPSAQQVRLIAEKKATGLKQAEAAYSKALEQGQNRLNTLKLRIPADPKKQSDLQKQQIAALTAEVGDQRKAAGDTLNKAKQATQDEYEESLSGLGLGGQHFSYKDQTMAPAGGPPTRAETAPGPPAGRGGARPPATPSNGQQRPATASNAPKKASLEQVRAWAQKNNLSESEAIKRAIAEGYTVSRPAQER